MGTPLTVHGLWLSSGWVKTYGESLFVLQEAHGSLKSLLCFFWARLQEGHSYQATAPAWPSLLLATVATLFWDWMSFPPKDGSELSETLPTYGRTLEGVRQSGQSSGISFKMEADRPGSGVHVQSLPGCPPSCLPPSCLQNPGRSDEGEPGLSADHDPAAVEYLK